MPAFRLLGVGCTGWVTQKGEKMKKLILVLVVVLMVAAFLASPLAVMADWPGAPCGAVGGEPPGWSQVSRGEGGTGSPGIGPGAP